MKGCDILDLDKEDIFSGETKPVILTQDSMFMNANTLFIEYNDIIRPIGFLVSIFLNRIKKDYNGLFDLSPIDGLEYDGIWEWYINRKNQNVIYELLSKENKNSIPFHKLDEIESTVIDSIEHELFHIIPELAFCQTLNNLIKIADENLIKHIIIWYPIKNEKIQEDVKELFGEKVQIKFGPIGEVLRKIPEDSTYVFSDITNIILLEDLDKLKYSSVVVPYNISYNMIGDNLKIKIEEYEKYNLFKFTFFNNL